MTGASLELPDRDYISPGFSKILLDEHFPNMEAVRDPQVLERLELLKTRKLFHNYYSDKRFPRRGFVNRDEAHILYNTALRYKDKRTLEIGCWLGWSTCHLLAGGVSLDVIDPVLQDEGPRNSVIESINSCGFGSKVRLHGGSSPDAVAALGLRDNLRWSLFFIDGNHHAPGPIVDAFISTRYAEPDCLILFHDLWQPAVVEALDYLKSEGWNTGIYSTFAIMAAAWRGVMEPVEHTPDPETDWTLPENLKSHSAFGL